MSVLRTRRPAHTLALVLTLALAYPLLLTTALTVTATVLTHAVTATAWALQHPPVLAAALAVTLAWCVAVRPRAHPGRRYA